MIASTPMIATASGAIHDRSDADLIGECLSGRQAAWNELVDRYSRLVYAAARRCGLCDADAEDVHQNVFVSLYRHLDGVTDANRLSSWLLTTARREAWRAARRRLALIDGEPEVADSDDSAADLAELERAAMVRLALRRLGGRCQQLLTALFSAPGTPNYAAIATDLGMKTGSIGPTRARCFRKLERILLEMGFDPASEWAAHESALADAD
jgi:RNA polymerase sigma factor (sigma-70 family)